MVRRVRFIRVHFWSGHDQYWKGLDGKKYLKVPRNTSKYPEVHLSNQKYLRVPRSTSKCPEVPQSTQKYLTVPISTAKYPEVPQSTQKYPTVPISTSKYPEVPQSTQKYLITIWSCLVWSVQNSLEQFGTLRAICRDGMDGTGYP